MAYSAVISLNDTIHRLLNSSHISILSPGRELLEFTYKQVKSVQEALQKSDDAISISSCTSKKLNALDGKIRDEIWKLEDEIESHVSSKIVSQSETLEREGSSRIPSIPREDASQVIISMAQMVMKSWCNMLNLKMFSIDMKDLTQDILPLLVTVKKMKGEYIYELDNPLPEEEDDDDAAVSSNIDFDVKIVGLSDDFTEIKKRLLQPKAPDDFCVIAIVGIAGTGRTFVARTIFDDLYIGKEQSFDCAAWVTIGPNYQLKEILLSILAQIDDGARNDRKLPVISEGDEGNIGEYLSTSLKGRRYMIVLDNICDTHIWGYLTRSFPKQDNGSLVLLTTGLSLMEVALFGDNYFFIHYMGFFDEDRIWKLLCLGIFGLLSCPPELEEAGKKIVENCQGRYLAVIKIVHFLLKAENMQEWWNKLAADEENSIFMFADEISEICKIKEDVQPHNSLPTDDGRSFIILATILIDVLSTRITVIKNQLSPNRLFPKMEIISFLGMAGIGKTTFVKKFFEDQSTLSRFDYCAWVTLGPKYQSKEILVDILAQMYPDIDKMRIKRDAQLTEYLCSQLSYKRCLIVLDDVWSKKPFNYLKKLFQDIKGTALVTTRLAKVAQFEPFNRVHKMRLLNKEESWRLFCHKVFGEGSCPLQLEKAGKMISENCEGLPLLILTVASLLSKANRTPEYWNKEAKKKNSSIFMAAYDQISEVLLPSYEYLPQYLKACFLYMGVFRQNYEISISMLTRLWIAEGFLEPNPSQFIEDFAAECLSELVDRSLVMVRQEGFNFKTRTCCLHSVFWYLSCNEAMKNKFFYDFNTYVDNSIEDIKSQRRLCIRSNILSDIKDVYNSMASISTSRSLLFTGPRHQYPVPIYFGLRLLKVLHALSIRFYEFPKEVLKLALLRYLALTCNGKLPVSISKLRNLQYLIVSQHLSIKSSENSFYLPSEIWDMKELKHLQIMGYSLPNPNYGASLPNLLTLLGVSIHNFTREVFEGIPNLKRLGIQIELTPDDDGKTFHFLNHVFLLHTLESLKCVVVNPELRSKAVALPAPISMFPSGLKKLSLSGLGYPWEYMKIIGKLKNLEVLKLRRYAFRGPEWKTNVKDFIDLKFLLIEDTDLACWECEVPSFSKLQYLSIKHCYKLKKLPCRNLSVNILEIVDCNPLAVAWAEHMKHKDPYSWETLKLEVHSSWDYGNLKQ